MQSPTVPIGIDFGTFYPNIGVWQQGRVEIISDGGGNNNSSSRREAFTSTGYLVGHSVRNQMDVNPGKTNFGVKGLMDNNFYDIKIMQNSESQSFYVTSDSGRTNLSSGWEGETIYFPTEKIIAMVVTALRKYSENHQGTCIKDTVISVPAYFNSFQRKAIKELVTIAGLNVLRIISKPALAALAYNILHHNVEGQKNVLIFDLGDETTEVSVVKISGGTLEVKAVAFDQSFGGNDFDNRLVKHLTNEVKRRLKIDLKPPSVYKLQSAAQKAKHHLSSDSIVEVEIDNLVDNIKFCTKVTRSKFEEVCKDLFKKTLDPVKKALNDAKLSTSTIDDIFLIGGSAIFPKIQSILKNFFPNVTFTFPNDPEVTVAYGAAIYAAILSRDMILGPKIPFGLKSLVDVTSYSISVGTTEGEIIKIINRNTTIPWKLTRSLTTDTECQQTITLNVYEGERALSTKNYLLCTIEIDIPSEPHSVPKIDVTFSLDENGILKITAEENIFHTSKPLKVTEIYKEEVNGRSAE